MIRGLQRVDQAKQQALDCSIILEQLSPKGTGEKCWRQGKNSLDPPPAVMPLAFAIRDKAPRGGILEY